MVNFLKIMQFLKGLQIVELFELFINLLNFIYDVEFVCKAYWYVFGNLLYIIKGVLHFFYLFHAFVFHAWIWIHCDRQNDPNYSQSLIFV